ncbi:hypothetical protein DFJ77DRAFT_462769 [Powellomyces hirtus]|nr:hypothetical protein DFJ77DRAFT_462769 [Powellomyces hirtus]
MPPQTAPLAHSASHSKPPRTHTTTTTTTTTSTAASPPPPRKMGFFSRVSECSWPQLAVGLSIVAAVIVISLEAVIIAHVREYLQDAFDRRGNLIFVMVYFGLFVLGMLFQAALTCEAYIHKNTMQTIAVAVFNVACFGYSVVQVYQLKPLGVCNDLYRKAIQEGWPNTIRDRFDVWVRDYPECDTVDLKWMPGSRWGPRGEAAKFSAATMLANVDHANNHLHTATIFGYAVIGVMFVMAAASCFLAYKVYREYGWHIFQQQGASLVKKRLLRHVHLFILFLKVNLYFSFGIVLQIVVAMVLNKIAKMARDEEKFKASVNQQNPSDPPDSITAQSEFWLPPMIILAAVAASYYACGWFAIQYANRSCMYAFFALIMGNIIAVVYVIVASQTALKDELKVTEIWLKSFAAVQLLLNVMTMVNAVMCLKGFDSGLREMVQARRRKNDVEEAPGISRPRIELD